MLKSWPTLRDGLLLLLALAVSGLGFWWLAVLVGFPQYYGHNVSILLQPTPTAKVLAIVLGVVILGLLCTLLTGRIRYDAGWGCVAAGLYAWRLRGGTIYHTLNGREASVFYLLAIELALLALLFGAAWALLHTLRERGSASTALRRVLELPDARTRIADRKATAETLDQKLLAMVICAALTAFFMLILCRDDDRSQVFFALALSSWLAVWITHSFISTRPGAWFWGGPILAGLIGYAWAGFSTHPQQLAIGNPGGWLGPLARPLPLDYISVALPFALWRYVRSRTHQSQQVAEAQSQADTQPAATPKPA